MRKIIYLLVAVLLVSCASNQRQVDEQKCVIEAMKVVSIKQDSVTTELTMQISNLIEERDILILERNILTDSVLSYRIRADTLHDRLLISDYKLARIQHYINICSKATNKKYLYGWIRRVLEN